MTRASGVCCDSSSLFLAIRRSPPPPPWPSCSLILDMYVRPSDAGRDVAGRGKSDSVQSVPVTKMGSVARINEGASTIAVTVNRNIRRLLGNYAQPRPDSAASELQELPLPVSGRLPSIDNQDWAWRCYSCWWCGYALEHRLWGRGLTSASGASTYPANRHFEGHVGLWTLECSLSSRSR